MLHYVIKSHLAEKIYQRFGRNIKIHTPIVLLRSTMMGLQKQETINTPQKHGSHHRYLIIYQTFKQLQTSLKHSSKSNIIVARYKWVRVDLVSIVKC